MSTSKKRKTTASEEVSSNINSINDAIKELENIKNEINSIEELDNKKKYEDDINNMLSEITIITSNTRLRWVTIEKKVKDIILQAKRLLKAARKEIEEKKNLKQSSLEEEFCSLNLEEDSNKKIERLNNISNKLVEDSNIDVYIYGYFYDDEEELINLVYNNKEIIKKGIEEDEEMNELYIVYKEQNEIRYKNKTEEVKENRLLRDLIKETIKLLISRNFGGITFVIIKDIIKNFIDLNTSCKEEDIIFKIILKLKLITEGEFSPIELHDIIIDYIDKDNIEDIYNNDMSKIADEIRENEKYRGTIYTPKQLAKSYNIIADSFIIKGYKKPHGEVIIEYLKIIQKDPLLALKTLLWIDTFHDFKGGKGSRVGTITFNVKKEEYSFLEFYRNSFFTITNGIVTGFSEGIEHTVLKDISKDVSKDISKERANLLYQVSSIFIQKKDFESDLLWAYLIMNFNFDLDSTKSILENLKNIFWSQIDIKDVEYYAKDVDRGSGNMLRGNKVILPASLFDANSSNSSSKANEFVNIPSTIIPYASGYEFDYKFEYKKGDEKEDKKQGQVLAICDFELGYRKETEKKYSLTLKNSCKTKSTRGTKNEDDEDDSGGYFDSQILENFFKNDQVGIPEGTKGMSPKLIVQIIKALYNNNKELKCPQLDFWVSLKRIGDYGQILQCKQLGIPLFTTDSMQLLISIAVKSSVIWSPDFTKVIWYDGISDTIKCSNHTLNKYTCSIGKLDSKINKGDKVIFGNKEYTIDSLTPDINGLYTLSSSGFNIKVSLSEIKKSNDIDIMLDNKGFRILENARKVLEDVHKTDTDNIVLSELKEIPNIRV
jgi:hypothetical protein